MKSKDFLEEVLRSDICPDNFERIYSEFQEYQKLILDAFREFHKICEKFSIPYQLADGSLLGAVRDGGQIPWDYDVDVFVPYQEKNRLIEALNQELPNELYLYCPELCSTCPHYFPRISLKGFRSDVLHIDVFYLIGSPDVDIERKKFIAEVAKTYSKRTGKLMNIRQLAYGNIKRYIALTLKRKLPYIISSLDETNKKYSSLCSKYPYLESKFNITADRVADINQYPTEKLWETIIVTLEYGEARIPVYYDDILSLGYGDYLTIPSLENRLEEMLNHYKHIIKYGILTL